MFFVLLFPGTVAGLVPLLLLRALDRLRFSGWSVSSMSALLVVSVGVAGLLWCVWDFFAVGSGTLAPVDPPKNLVVHGLYRLTRNPMYNAVVFVLLGEAWLFRSLQLLEYAGVVFLFFHIFVVFYEERTLKSRFGEAYRAYQKAVPRWGLTFRLYSEHSGGAPPN